jgi:predicted MPP superfamily phosphohydrolase
LLLFVGGLIYGFFIEPNRLVVRSQTIKITNWPAELSGLRIAVISDVHTGGPFIDYQKLQLIVERTNSQHPDLIVLLGDYMSPNSWHSHHVEPNVTAGVLKNLKAPLGVYAVLGNHDWWYDGAIVRRAFEENGIPVLEDQVKEIKWRNRSFWLAGLADFWTRPQRIEPTLAKIPTGSTIIALTHNPDIFTRLPTSVPLMIAGHTHGAQVQIPFVGPLVAASERSGHYYGGYYFDNGHHLFITTGIGTSLFPMRFRVPPEIVILTITN